jgi:glycosyltransferase involved in cell wall biosynthesis
MRFLIDIADLRLPLQNKYTRVLRALLRESQAGAGLAVRILNGRMVSAQVPNEVSEPVWWYAVPCARIVHPRYWVCAIKLLVFYFCTEFAGKPLTHRRKDELGWNLAYSFELFTPSWRKRLAQFLEVDLDPNRNFIFYHWLGERGFTIESLLALHDCGTDEEISAAADDILVLCGTSWRYKVETLTKLKNAHGFRLVFLIYDLLPIDYPSLVTVVQRRQYSEYLCGVGRIADLIITPTVFTASGLQAFFAQRDISSAVVSTVALSSASLRGPGEISQRLIDLGLHEKKFMLCVGSLRERKHILWLYALCTRLRVRQTDLPLVVFAGSVADLTIVRHLAKDPNWGNAGVFVEAPLDAELSWLFQNACLCLQPSFEGGLGMAVTEAINYGRMCIAGDAASLVEASSGLAEHLPHDETIWANTIQRLSKAGECLDTEGASGVPTETSPGVLAQIRALLAEISGVQ